MVQYCNAALAKVMSTMVDTVVQNQVETIEVVKPTVVLWQHVFGVFRGSFFTDNSDNSDNATFNVFVCKLYTAR